MLNKEKLEQLMAILGELTEGQRAFLTEALSGPIREKELFEKLDDVEEGKFEEFLKAVTAELEDEVLAQPLSPDELEAVSGGDQDDDLKNCVRYSERNIYLGGFPNCAATVEDGSFCSSNDACYHSMVGYYILVECNKAWR
jgi:hypothetical protein